MARTDLETLVFSLEASTAKFNKAIDKMNRDFNRQMSGTERRAKQMQSSLNATFAKIGGGVGGIGKGAVGGLLGGLAASASVQGIEDAVAKLAKIGDVADRVGVTTDAIQKLRYAVEQTGGTADDADAAIQRFAKEFGTAGSNVRKVFQQAGVEIRGMNVEQAFEAYLDIIDRTTAAQNKLAISAAAFGKAGGNTMVLAAEGGAKGFRALGDQAVRAGAVIDKNVVARARDLDDEITKLRNSISGLGGALVSEFGGPALVSALRDILSLLREISQFSDRMKGVYEDIKRTGTLRFTEIGSFQSGVNRLKSQQNMGVEPPTTAELAAFYKAAGVPGPAPLGARAPTITINKPPADDPFANGLDVGTKSENEYQREVQAINEKIAALKLEGETYGQTAGQIAEAEAKLKLMQAAEEAGIKVTPELNKTMDELAAKMGAVTTATESTKRALDAVKEAQVAAASEMSGAFESLIVDGEKLNQVFADVLRNLARMLIQASLAGSGPLAGLLGTASTTGGAGGLAGLLFGGFRAGGGSVRAGRAYMVGEKGPEIVVPRMAGQVIPNDKLRAVRGGGQAISVTINAPINAPGADPAQLQRLVVAVAELKADVPRQVRAGLGAAQNRRVRV